MAFFTPKDTHHEYASSSSSLGGKNIEVFVACGDALQFPVSLVEPTGFTLIYEDKSEILEGAISRDTQFNFVAESHLDVTLSLVDAALLSSIAKSISELVAAQPSSLDDEDDQSVKYSYRDHYNHDIF